jgi:hypothetical protein
VIVVAAFFIKLNIPGKKTSEACTQTDEWVYCPICNCDRTVLAKHICILRKSVTPTPHQLHQVQTLKNLKYPAQLGDILLKLRFNQHLGFVDSPRLQSIENMQVQADWAARNGFTGTTSRLLAEKLEAHFSHDLDLLDRYLDEVNIPPVTVDTISLPQL